MPKPKPNPQDIKKPITLSLDGDTITTISNVAMKYFHGNLSAAVRQIVAEYVEVRQAYKTPPPQ